MKKFTLLVLAMCCLVGTYGQVNPASKTFRDSGVKPMAAMPGMKTLAFTEGFETFVPPATLNGWTIVNQNTSYTWDTASYAPQEGFRNMHCLYDDNLQQQNEMLITPLLDFSPSTVVTVNFWWNGSKYWSVTPYDNCDLNLLYSLNGGTSWSTPVWSEETDTTFETWVWRMESVTIPAVAGCATVKFAFQYYGLDGAEFSVDLVTIDTVGGIFVGVNDGAAADEGFSVYPSPANNSITVRTASAGDYFIFNAAGQRMRSGRIESTHSGIDISALPEGFYYIEMTGGNGRSVRKFCIAR